MIILPILYVVSAHHSDFPEVGILLPLDGKFVIVERVGGVTYIEKINLFEEFLLVVFELADHFMVNG